MQEEIEELEEDLAELQQDFTLAMEELAATQEAVEHTSSQLNQVLLERREMVNRGKIYEDVGSKQQRKLNYNGQLMPLFGLESFGLVPMQVIVWTPKSDEAISIPLGGNITPLPDTQLQPAREIDEVCAMRTLPP